MVRLEAVHNYFAESIYSDMYAWPGNRSHDQCSLHDLTFERCAGLSYLSLTLVGKNVARPTLFLALKINTGANGGIYGKHMWEVTFRDYSANQLLVHAQTAS